ncbi:MAG: DUF1292 domain-containing protein [Firmicutes bacterium]|nr:DUF1292 domain-containing protein [Bacillota bacterium]
MPDEESIVTLVDEDGKEKDFTVTEVVEIDDAKYAVLVPVESLSEDEDEEFCEEDAYILRIETDENGEEILTDIEDDDEYERVLEALEALDEEDDDFDEDEDEEDEEEEEEDY